MKVLRVVLLLVGLGLLVVLVIENDPAAVLDSVRRLSWRILSVLVFPMALVMVLDALGWRYAFLHYRVPVYAELDRLCGGNLHVVFSATRTPPAVTERLTSQLGDRAIALNGEARLRLGGVSEGNFANVGHTEVTEARNGEGFYEAVVRSLAESR